LSYNTNCISGKRDYNFTIRGDNIRKVRDLLKELTLLGLLFLLLHDLSKFNNPKRGIILVYVLLMLTAILSSLSLFLFYSKHLYYSHNELTTRFKILFEAYSVAKMAIAYSVKTINRLGGYSANIPAKFRIRIDSREYTALVEAEDGKLPIVYPYVEPSAIFNLFKSLRINENKAVIISDSIIDFQDPDNLKRLNGAEAEFYMEKNYSPPNKRLFSLQALLWVRGIDYSVYTKIKPYVTVYSTKVNVNYASLEVLTAIGMPENVARIIIEERKKRFISMRRVYELLGPYAKRIKTNLSYLSIPEFFRVTIREKMSGEELTLVLDLNAKLIDVLWY